MSRLTVTAGCWRAGIRFPFAHPSSISGFRPVAGSIGFARMWQRKGWALLVGSTACGYPVGKSWSQPYSTDMYWSGCSCLRSPVQPWLAEIRSCCTCPVHGGLPTTDCCCSWKPSLQGLVWKRRFCRRFNYETDLEPLPEAGLEPLPEAGLEMGQEGNGCHWPFAVAAACDLWLFDVALE